MKPDPTTPSPGWFDRPGTHKTLWRLLYLACGISVVSECYVHREHHFSIDGFFGFYAVLGFIACAVSILVAKVLGYILKKPENYYGDLPEEEPADLDPARHDRA
ncbi:MAG: hypothetical protein WBE58_20985 [Verrucomicrobiales bacterium]